MERKNSQLKKLEEVVKKHIDAGHNMIMSSESFAHKDESYWITEKSAKFLQEIFSGYHIEVVVSYRRMSDFVHSRYPTLVCLLFQIYSKWATEKSCVISS